MHWSDLVRDPMDAAATDRRRRMLRAARRDPISDRVGYLRKLASGARVLDIGVVDHSSDTDRRENWLHGQLADVGGEVVGIDIVEHEVERLRERGFDVRLMDVTAGERPDGRFELIVAGELVEHLGNPEGLFDAAAALLTDDGLLVLTTPNPYALWRVFQAITDRPRENLDHALLLSPWGIIELAERAGLQLRSYRGIGPTAVGWKAKAFEKLLSAGVLRLTPETACESILYEVVRP